MNKETVKLAAKVYGRTVVAGILCAIMYVSVITFTFLAADDKGVVPNAATVAANVAALIFQSILFVSFIYNDVWRQGDKDANAVSFGRMAYDKWRGLKVGLLASVPSFLTFVVLVAEKLTGFFPFYAAWYRVFHVSFYPVLQWAFGRPMNLTTAQIGWGGIVMAIIPVLVLPITAVAAYALGYKQIAVGERLVYKKKKK